MKVLHFFTFLVLVFLPVAGSSCGTPRGVCRPSEVPTNGKRMVYLDNMSPRGQEQASHALYGACGRFGEPLGASWGLRRASNGLEHGLPARTVKRFGTVSVQVLGVAPRGFPLAERRASPPLRAHVEGSAPPPEAARGRSGRSGWPFWRPTN